MNIGFVLAWLCFAVALLIPLWLLVQFKFRKSNRAITRKPNKILPKNYRRVDIPVTETEIKTKTKNRRPNPFNPQSSSKTRSHPDTNRLKVGHTGRTKDSAKYNQFLAMLNGDRAIADRLIEAYGIDKAISDLIRDRQ